jgi:glycosyltransferase involved in cell wall biosynthesis
VKNLKNQSSSNSINIVNNQTLNNHINSVNNQTLKNPINNIINLTNQFNNSLINSTHNLRNLELNNSNSSYLRDFYLACDRRKLIIVRRNESEIYGNPLISVIIPFFNKKLELLRTIRSIQLQTLKNIEIIILDDESINAKKYHKNILDSDFRIRVFTQNKNLGVWRKRIDGFLYSRGEYILHINPGDILSDSFVLEDLYNIVHKYNLDTVRFSFSKTNYDSKFRKNIEFSENRIYPNKFTKIIYGNPGYNVHIFGYGTIWNRLVRSGILRKALDLVDEDILNVHKDIWEDMWLNDLIDRVSFSNLIVNRLGYTFLYDINNAFQPRSTDKFLREKTIREFILFWLFDLKLLPKENNKQAIIDKLKTFIRPDNIFGGERVSLEFLTHKYGPYEILLASLIEDPSVSLENRIFAYKLYKEIKKK